MANRLTMATISAIHTLHRSGYSNRKIAELLDIHRETVGEYVRELQNRPNAPTGSGDPTTDRRKRPAGILILTSEEPLPVFSELRPEFESQGWTTIATGGLWQFDGSQVSQVFPSRKERGSIERLTAKGFRELCLSVTQRLPDLSVTGFAFSVE